MATSSPYQIKKKNINDKEVLEFLLNVEERFESDEVKIKEFIDIIDQEGTLR